MKIKNVLFGLSMALFFQQLSAQDSRAISVEEAVTLALNNSNASKISDAKLRTAAQALNVTKNLQYPNVELAGQYRYLTNANVNLKLPLNSAEDGQETAAPKINQLVMGQANVSMPLFSGFKLKNLLQASSHQLEAAQFSNANEKEQLAMHVIADFLNLYKSTQAITLIEENLKRAKQREKDFSAMEENGILARNDLLKSRLQVSNFEIAFEEAKKMQHILNYKLAILLKLPENTAIDTQLAEDTDLLNQTLSLSSSRNDLQALNYTEKAAEAQVKVAQSNYYPSVAIVGGYLALDLNNALTVTNAMNVGLGVSYNLSDIFKAKSDIKLARSKVETLNYTIDDYTDQIKIEIENAKQDYELALRKSEVYSESELQATENYRIVKDKYDNGLVDTNDLLEADVDQLQAKINLTNSKADSKLKYYEFLTAKGQLLNSINP